MSERTKAENRAAMAKHLIGQYEARVASGLAGEDGLTIYRSLSLGDTIEKLDEFQVGPNEWMKVGECKSISARWMIGSPYYPNLYVPARRLQSANATVSSQNMP